MLDFYYVSNRKIWFPSLGKMVDIPASSAIPRNVFSSNICYTIYKTMDCSFDTGTLEDAFKITYVENIYSRGFEIVDPEKTYTNVNFTVMVTKDSQEVVESYPFTTGESRLVNCTNLYTYCNTVYNLYTPYLGT